MNSLLKLLAGVLFATCAVAWVACATIPDFQVGASDGSMPVADAGVAAADGAARPADGSAKDGWAMGDANEDRYLVFFATQVPGFFAADAGDPLLTADSICTTQANQLAPNRKWRAMLSRQSDAGEGLDRIGISPGDGWYSLSGELAVAKNPASGIVEADVQQADGGAPDRTNVAWTGPGLDCAGWTSNQSQGLGVLVGSRKLWPSLTPVNCVDVQNLYCFEVP